MVYYQKIHYFALQLHVIMNILRHISNVSWNICMQYPSNRIYMCICIENIFCTDMCNQRQVWVRMLPGSCLWCQSINSFYTAEGWREMCTLIFPLVQSHTLQLCILNKSWNILSMNNAFGVFPSFIRKTMHALIKILVSDLSWKQPS